LPTDVPAKTNEDTKLQSTDPPGKVTVATQTYNGDEISDSNSQKDQQDSSAPAFSAEPKDTVSNDNNNLNSGEASPFKKDLLTFDPHCYECKVRYRDPKPKDLIMYLHAIKYGVG
jgi:hypothetical protein